MLALSQFLALNGFFVYQTRNKSEFEKIFNSHNPDLVIVDKNLAQESGLDLIRFVREDIHGSSTPVILISGDEQKESCLQAFPLGADDVVYKPVQFSELLLRVQACLRRSASYVSSEEVIQFENIQINLKSHDVFINDKKIHLTNTEYKIFLELLTRKDEVLNRERLVTKVLSLNNSSVRTLDVHINSLRKKLGTHSKKIKTVRGRGYLFKSVI